MEYKRLTKSYKGAPLHTDMEVTDGDEIYERLAELEDKIKQGTLIELPCKVGDTIYLISEKRWSIKKKKTYWYIRKTKLTYGNMERIIKEYGEFVFLTREEAEKRLEELQE